MFVYWFIYLFPFALTFFKQKKSLGSAIEWFIVAILFIVVIGFRDEIGCDWYNYLYHYDETVRLPFSEAFKEVKDPAHTFVNWLVGYYHGGIYGVNFVYAIIFVISLIKFVRLQLEPWLAFSVAVPYMVITVAMGYSRQGVALGLFMLAITQLQKKRFKSYIFWVFVAGLFHKSAIVLLPFGLFLSSSGIWVRLLILLPVLYGGWDLLLSQKQDELWDTYVTAQMHSAGAKIRVIMNFVPAILFFMYRDKWKRNFDDYPFWFWVSISAVLSLFIVSFATTAVDRISLYLIPLQLVVYSRLPFFLQHTLPYSFTKFMILFFYAIVLFVWLNFAHHASCWIPYQNILFNTGDYL
jgi:hypothetical protein